MQVKPIYTDMLQVCDGWGKGGHEARGSHNYHRFSAFIDIHTWLLSPMQLDIFFTLSNQSSGKIIWRDWNPTSWDCLALCEWGSQWAQWVSALCWQVMSSGYACSLLMHWLMCALETMKSIKTKHILCGRTTVWLQRRKCVQTLLIFCMPEILNGRSSIEND